MSEIETRFAAQHAEWRDPATVVAQWAEAGTLDPALLQAEATGPWWDLLDAAGMTLLVTREYEHLVLALGARAGAPQISFLRLPHPSGIAVDAMRGEVHIASTRNPNAIYTLHPAAGLLPRRDLERPGDLGRPLMPTVTRFLPGSTYLHDLAMLGGALHATAVGSNAIIEQPRDGEARAVWWPASIEGPDGPDFSLNHLQLNGIAAGPTLADSFFTASVAEPGGPRPGDPAFPVDGRGVVFSGASRAPMLRGLTRPHSPRFIGGRLWVDDSGYGLVCAADGERAEPVVRLPGWTRGLCEMGAYAIVGTSRVIPRFRAYAPGLDPERCACGLHAVDIATGRVVAGLTWPTGNQIFAIAALPSTLADGLPFRATRGAEPPSATERTLFYAWRR